MTRRYVDAASMAAAGVLGTTLPCASNVMKEDSRLRVISLLELSSMRLSLMTCLGFPLVGVRPVEFVPWVVDSMALRALDASAKRLRSSSAALSAAIS